MTFQLVQEFDKVEYSYDAKVDVLDVSFGPPASAVALQIEDWLALRIGLKSPGLQGITVVSFKRIFERLNRYVEQQLPRRMKRLSKAQMEITYHDNTDTLIMRVTERAANRRKRKKGRAAEARQGVSIVEPSSPGMAGGATSETEKALRNVYIEKTLPSKDFVGVKIFEYTKCGPAAMEAIFGALIDTIFREPRTGDDENLRLFTNALIQRVDWQHLAHVASTSVRFAIPPTTAAN